MRFVWFLFETATRCPSLQNEQSTLPLQGIGSLRKVALLGPAIDDGLVLLGDYANMDAPTVSFAAAAVDAFAPSTTLAVARGCVVTPMFVYWLYDTWLSESTATLRGGVVAKAYYTVCFSIMMLGSYIWMYKLLTGYAKYLAKKGKKAD